MIIIFSYGCYLSRLQPLLLMFRGQIKINQHRFNCALKFKRQCHRKHYGAFRGERQRSWQKGRCLRRKSGLGLEHESTPSFLLKRWEKCSVWSFFDCVNGSCGGGSSFLSHKTTALVFTLLHQVTPASHVLWNVCAADCGSQRRAGSRNINCLWVMMSKGNAFFLLLFALINRRYSNLISWLFMSFKMIYFVFSLIIVPAFSQVWIYYLDCLSHIIIIILYIIPLQ